MLDPIRAQTTNRNNLAFAFVKVGLGQVSTTISEGLGPPLVAYVDM